MIADVQRIRRFAAEMLTDYVRQRPADGYPDAASLPQSDDAEYSTASRPNASALFAELMQELPDRPRDLIRRRLAGQSFEEIGKAWNVDAKRAESLFKSAMGLTRARLRARMRGQGGEGEAGGGTTANIAPRSSGGGGGSTFGTPSSPDQRSTKSKFRQLRERMGATNKLVGDIFGDTVAFSTKSAEGPETELVLRKVEDEDDAVILENIKTPPASMGRGQAKMVMQSLVSAADDLGMSIYLDIDPESSVGRGETPPMNRDQLRAWYSKFGFRFGDSGRSGLRLSKQEIATRQAETLPPLRQLPPEQNGFSDTEALQNTFAQSPGQFREGETYFADGSFAFTVNGGRLMRHRGTRVNYDLGTRQYVLERFEDAVPEPEVADTLGTPAEVGTAADFAWAAGTKVVDESGRPRVLYHGTDATFDVFDPKKMRASRYGRWFYFTTNPERAKAYGSNVIPVLIKAEQLVTSGVGSPDTYSKSYAKKVGDTYMVTNPDQIRILKPNPGQDTLGTPAERADQTQTPEFKRWFGDWEAVAAQNAEQKRGEAAIDQLLSAKTGEMVGMARAGIGDVVFTYGTAGRPNTKGRLIEGGGLAHLVAQRDLEKKDGRAIARLMPSVIAHGRVVAIQGEGTTGERIRIEHGGHTAVLSLFRDGLRKTWLLTGWENEEGGAGVNPATAYAPSGSGISRKVGASFRIEALNAQIVNPEAVSKVVDAQGRPRVVYHGTASDFDAFDTDMPPRGASNEVSGSFFTTIPSYGSNFANRDGGRVIPAYLSIKNPADEDAEADARYLADDQSAPIVRGQTMRGEDERIYLVNSRKGAEVKRRLMAAGYDGIARNIGDGFVYVAFAPTQIKSAIANRGTFDPADPSILGTPSEQEENEAVRRELDAVANMSGLDAAKLESDYRRALAEPIGERTVGDPRLANPGLSDETRAVVSAVDEQRREDMERESHALWQAEAERRLSADFRGVVRDLLEQARSGGDIAANPVGVKSAQLAVERLSREAFESGDAQKLRDAQTLAYAYRVQGTDQARALAARRDPFKTPEQRHREFFAGLIFTPPEPARRRRKVAGRAANRSTGRSKARFSAETWGDSEGAGREPTGRGAGRDVGHDRRECRRSADACVARLAPGPKPERKPDVQANRTENVPAAIAPALRASRGHGERPVQRTGPEGAQATGAHGRRSRRRTTDALAGERSEPSAGGAERGGKPYGRSGSPRAPA